MKNYVTQEHFNISIARFGTRIGNMETRMAGFVTKNEFHNRLDEVITILKRLDQERLFTVEWICRIESDVNQMKGQLNIA